MIRSLLLGAAAAAALSGAAYAQTFAVTNARIHTAGPAGDIESGTVVVRDGRIAAVGANVQVPSGARVIDAQGRVVTPGIVVPNTTLSVAEVNSLDQTNDFASSSPNVSAAFDVQYGVNPDSVVIPVARLGGVTRAIVTPSLTGRGDDHGHEDFAGGGGDERSESLFGGQAAVIHLGRGPNIVVKPNVAMVTAFGEEGAEFVGGSRGAAIVALNNALDDVRHYQRNRAAFDRAGTRDYALSRADLEALIPVVEGRMPLVVTVSSASDIRQVLKLARERNLKVIIESGEEAWLVADELARAGVPVILNPLTDLPDRFETQGATMENAARLQRAGVLVAIAGDRTGHYARQARYNAGNAVANGMPWAEALKAITINPARIYGVADRFGSLEPGKEADLVIWSGDPFEPLTQPAAVFIRGEEQPMTSRQIELRDRYMRRDGPMPPAYSR
jgi:imidazolonepropionase-like amidohydrolase